MIQMEIQLYLKENIKMGKDGMVKFVLMNYAVYDLKVKLKMEKNGKEKNLIVLRT